MDNFEDIVLPPEGSGSGNRYESADVDIEHLRQYLKDTKFETEAEVFDLLTRRFSMHREDDISEIESNMTRVISLRVIKEILDPEGRIAMSHTEVSRLVRDGLFKKQDSVVIEGNSYKLTDEVRQALMGKPLSGHDPRAVLRMTIETQNTDKFDLRVFEVFNRNQKYRYTYILKPVE